MQLGWYLGRWSHGGRAGRGWPLPGTELVATAVPAACYSFSRREPLDCGSFEAQGRQGQRQSPGYVCLASRSKVTARLGTPVGEGTAKGLCRVSGCEHRACLCPSKVQDAVLSPLGVKGLHQPGDAEEERAGELTPGLSRLSPSLH